VSVHLALLLGYCALLVALGLRVGRHVRNASEFFVASRRLGPGLLFSTMLAANIGAGSTVGAAGLGYRDGLSAWWWVGSAGIGSLVLAFWVGPRIRRLAAAHDLRTVGDYLELRYSRSVRALVSGLLWLGTVSILSGQLIALAWVLSVVAGVPKPAGCLLGGVVMTVYFTAGGLPASAWVNLVQLVVLLAGFAAALPLALSRAGGVAAVMAATPQADGYWSFWQGGESGIAYLALLAPAFVVSPGLLQKIYGARDDRAVRVGVAANAVVLLLFALVPPALGMVARASHPGLAEPELALPTVLLRELPPLIGSLALLAVVSAEISTADAILFMLATSLSQDFYRRFLRPEADDAAVLRVARWAAVLGGGLGVLLSILLPTVIDALTVFYSLLTVSLLVPIIGGLLFRRLGSAEALAAILGGVVAMLAAKLAGPIPGVPSPALSGILVSLLAAAIVMAQRGRSIGRRWNPRG
jgi:solute:Na+ symporter, SSS family